MGYLEKNEEQFRYIIGKMGGTFASDILEKNKDEEYDHGIIFDLANCDQNEYSQKLKSMCDSLSNSQNGNYSKKFVSHMLTKMQDYTGMLNELYIWIPDDLVRLELNVGKGKSKFIAIDAGSAGQRTSAILTLLLQISDGPIIIDQSEDDLDTKNITDFIVKGINNKKQNQQIIVVTHNPNIVVNTNSEQVVHMDLVRGEINAIHSGALQNYEIRDAICEVMEGGRDALESRYYRITKALEH